jgi:DNA-binding response OmpR family regulator
MNRHENTGVNTYDVLLVDSKKSSRELTGRMLERAGYRVMTAEHGQEALAMMQDTGRVFQLLITEISMPQMDGFELMKAVKSGWGIPVMFLTSVSDEATVTRVFRMGADDYMQKPFNDPELLQRVRQLLALRQYHPAGLVNGDVLQSAPPAPLMNRSSFAA